MEQPLEDGRFWDGAVLPLLKFCESLYKDNHALREGLISGGRDWKHTWIKAREAAELAGDGRKEFEPLYAALGDTKRFHEAVQMFLRIKSAL